MVGAKRRKPGRSKTVEMEGRVRVSGTREERLEGMWMGRRMAITRAPMGRLIKKPGGRYVRWGLMGREGRGIRTPSPCCVLC